MRAVLARPRPRRLSRRPPTTTTPTPAGCSSTRSASPRSAARRRSSIRGCAPSSLLAAALVHDVGRTLELSRGPAFAPTEEGRLLGHVHLGLRAIEERATGLTAAAAGRAPALRRRPPRPARRPDAPRRPSSTTRTSSTRSPPPARSGERPRSSRSARASPGGSRTSSGPWQARTLGALRVLLLGAARGDDARSAIVVAARGQTAATARPSLLADAGRALGHARPLRLLPRHGDRGDGGRRADRGRLARSCRSLFGIADRRPARSRRSTPGWRARSSGSCSPRRSIRQAGGARSPPGSASRSSRRSASASTSRRCMLPAKADPLLGVARLPHHLARLVVAAAVAVRRPALRLGPAGSSRSCLGGRARRHARQRPLRRLRGAAAACVSLTSVLASPLPDRDACSLAADRPARADRARSQANRRRADARRASLLIAGWRSDVEADVQDVAVGDDVGLALEALQAAARDLGVRAGRRRGPASRSTSQRMKPRAMSEWIAAAASSAVCAAAQRPGARLLLAGGEERDQVERVARAAARPPRAPRRRRRGRRPPPRRVSSASSASSARSIPPGPFSTASSGLVVSGSSSAGQLARIARRAACRPSTAARTSRSSLDLGAQLRVARLRLLVDPLEPRLDVVAVGDEQLELERPRAAAAGSAPGREAVEHGEQRVDLAQVAEQRRARSRERPGRGSPPG